MSKTIIENEGLEFIKKFVVVEFCIAAVVIICGGLAYGATSGQWGQVFIYSGVLLAGAAVAMGMIYRRAEQRCKTFNRR
jgi:hypothetical protein